MAEFKVSELNAAGALDGTEIFYVGQTDLPRKLTVSTLEAYIQLTDAELLSQLGDITLADIGTPAADDIVLIRDTSASNGVKGVAFSEFGGGGGGTAPTRSTTTLSGTLTAILIPSGCVKATFICTQQTRTGGTLTNLEVHTASAAINFLTRVNVANVADAVTASEAKIFDSVDDQGFKVELYSPRDSGEKTLAIVNGFTDGPSRRDFMAEAISATDDTEFVIATDGTSIAGTVYGYFEYI